MRRAALVAWLLVACADPPPPSAPTQPAASLDIPPMPPPKAAAQKPVVSDAPPPPDDDDDSPLPHDTALAEKEFQEGRRAAQNGDWALARKHLRMSLRYDPAVGTLLNLAMAEERLGDKPSAIRHYQAVYDECTRKNDTSRAALAKARMDALKASP